jgi:hypothetical protein
MRYTHVHTQVEQPIQQFPTVKKVVTFINVKPVADVLPLKGQNRAAKVGKIS